MEKHTISALIVAGAGVVGAVFQVVVLRAAKRKKAEKDEVESEERRRAFDAEHGIEEGNPD